MIAAPLLAFVVDGIEVRYILSNKKSELTPYQYEKIRGRRMHFFHGRFEYNSKQYYVECLIKNEMIEDVPFYEQFLIHQIEKEIKKIKHEHR